MLDVKKFTRIPDGGGWRAHGRGNVKKAVGIGTTRLHSMIDDHSRVAYCEFHDDETALTAVTYIKRGFGLHAGEDVLGRCRW